MIDQFWSVLSKCSEYDWPVLIRFVKMFRIWLTSFDPFRQNAKNMINQFWSVLSECLDYCMQYMGVASKALKWTVDVGWYKPCVIECLEM